MEMQRVRVGVDLEPRLSRSTPQQDAPRGVSPTESAALNLAEQPAEQFRDHLHDLIHEQIADRGKNRLENRTEVEHG